MLLRHFTPRPLQVRDGRGGTNTPFGRFYSLITETHLPSGTETFYFSINLKMSTMDLSIQPYMSEPESDPKREQKARCFCYQNNGQHFISPYNKFMSKLTFAVILALCAAHCFAVSVISIDRRN
ncbi:hypothetical protein CHARACLAT_030829 [Characodon lateralis]|uniref:Transmembrane protein n=1 Tax=Characodon lateralis TaxID=208331 RepID=A0ABU7CSP7_9TELE|nr:hypothetical protein [Characodon lateralis]